MRNSSWLRNLRFKVFSIIAVVLASLGFYALVQANPLTHVNASGPASAPASAPAPSFNGAPSDGSTGVGQSAQPAPIVQSAPIAPQPRLRTRGS